MLTNKREFLLRGVKPKWLIFFRQDILGQSIHHLYFDFETECLWLLLFFDTSASASMMVNGTFYQNYTFDVFLS